MVTTVNTSVDIVDELYNYGLDYDFNYSFLEGSDLIGDYNTDEHIMEDIKIARPPVICKPMPGPFMPCDDLMGWWSLRCGVWVVFLLAVLGNGTVLLVSVTSRTKMDVPRFLICNLACADFCMGVYLGFLAIVDASTLGEFKKYAIKWQTSPGCLVAGFLGVLSSELSVFTLTIITLERFYAITHAMHLNKRMSLRNAGYIMVAGWIFAITLASMPQYGISDFRKFAICLPFEIGDSISLGYVCFIMLMNCIAFIIIVSCYLKMYCSIRGSQAWNSNDSRVAKRMALLVFTDFACWAPISFFSLTAAFGHELISLNDAKVFAIFVLPLNSCANPFLYAIFTKQFKKDCSILCKRLEESAINRNISKASNRNLSLSWGSSRRPSALNSFFNNPGESGDKRSRQSSTGTRRPSVGSITQTRNNSAISKLTRFFTLRRIKSERVMRDPLELNSYGSRAYGQSSQYDSAINYSDVFGRSEPSSSAASAPPDTGRRQLLVGSRSRRILNFWKCWRGSQNRNHANLYGPNSVPPAVVREERVDQPSSDDIMSSQSPNPSNIDSSAPVARTVRKYNSPYGSSRKKLRRHRPRRKKTHFCGSRSGDGANGCCCASGHNRKDSLDLDSPTDYCRPHPSITDDSSGEFMSSGASGDISSTDSDDSEDTEPLPCSMLIQPSTRYTGFDGVDSNPHDLPSNNNNHEYVNVIPGLVDGYDNHHRMLPHACRNDTSSYMDTVNGQVSELDERHAVNTVVNGYQDKTENHCMDILSNSDEDVDETSLSVDNESHRNPKRLLNLSKDLPLDACANLIPECIGSNIGNACAPSESDPLLLHGGAVHHTSREKPHVSFALNHHMAARKSRSWDEESTSSGLKDPDSSLVPQSRSVHATVSDMNNDNRLCL